MSGPPWLRNDKHARNLLTFHAVISTSSSHVLLGFSIMVGF